MRKLLMAGVAAVALLAGCGVDKEGTGDNLIKELEKQTGLSFTDEQKDCLKDTVNGYSDDELKDLSDGKADADLQSDFQTKVADCLVELGG